MAYDEALATRMRTVLGDRDDVTERKMFGGLAFMVGDRMACGIIRDDLMVAVGPDAHDEAIAEPNARPMDFTGRPMRGMVYVAPDGVVSDAELAKWINRGVRYALSRPPKRR
jgi:TfoX/Sxy family transcriptional regulator of competence genes